jgi:hypothetical protein
MAEKKSINPNLVITVVGVAVGVFTISKILKSLGIIKDTATANAGILQIWWNPDFYQSLNWTQTKKNQVYTRALPAAEKIKRAFGIFSDNYNQILAAIKTMRTQAEVSFLADVFQYEYNEDLYAYLVDGYGGVNPATGLSTEHLKQLNLYISKLPKN